MTERLFSSLDRETHLQKLKNQIFDILVIGGGVTGCGIALDAAARGLSTALVEKDDFASGTSSKSTKLIHGGLRYLKQLDVGLVRETGTERAIVHKLAPHLVLPEKMIMPLIKGGTYGYFSTSLGLKIYDILAGVKGDDRRKMLSTSQTLKLEPLLSEDNLNGSGFYAEYRTDDARLTIELIKTAARLGATALNYTKVIDFIYDNKRVTGVTCLDTLSNITFNIRAKKIVSATGPWVDLLRSKDKSQHGKSLHLTKGVHIVVPHKTFPLRYTTYFDSHDKRMIFAVPRNHKTYIGTTDTNYKGDINDVTIRLSDVNYLLDAVHHAFPKVKIDKSDIESSWAGLRPLIHEDGKSPSELSRKDEIFTSPTGLISIAGGKLTGYRKMAQRIVDLVSQELSGKTIPCNTKQIYLHKQAFVNYEDVKKHISAVENILAERGLDQYLGFYLVHNYGKNYNQILDRMTDFEGLPEVNLARAELWYSIHYEMVQTPIDFFERRTGRLLFDKQSIGAIQAAVLSDMANYLHWTDERLIEETQHLDQVIEKTTMFL